MPDTPVYLEIEPPTSLRPFIRCLWAYMDPDPKGAVQRIAPDGCPELVMDFGAPYAEQGRDGVYYNQPMVLLAGQITRPMLIRPTGPVGVIAARFEPDGARDFLKAPLSSITDERIDVGTRFADFTLPEGSLEGRLYDLLQALAARLEDLRHCENWSLDPVVRAEIEAIAADHSTTRNSGSDNRALQRRFADRVGISPRALRSIHRFRKVFEHADLEGGPAWLEAGLEAGYFDQPQMARDFQRFLGCTATQWAAGQVELARKLASQSYKPALQVVPRLAADTRTGGGKT